MSRKFKATKMCLDVAAVLNHHREKAFDAVSIFEELFHSNEHHGWEIEFLEIMQVQHYLVKHGYAYGFGGCIQANELTSLLFEKGVVPQ